MIPGTKIISEPLADLPSSTSEGRASDDERSFAWAALKHGFVRGRGHHGTVEVVGIILGQAVSVNGVNLAKWRISDFF